MENEFIPYEEALALKELGFDEECFSFWIKPSSMEAEFMGLLMKPSNSNNSKFEVSAPLLQQAFKWFREEHNLHLEIRNEGYGFMGRVYKINFIKPKFISLLVESPEEVQLTCLRKLIEIVKEK